MFKSRKSEVIKESIKVEGTTKDHALKVLFDSDEAPEITSIGYVAIPSTNKFVSYVITSRGNEITKIEVSEPDLRSVAEDEAKISFVNCFMAGQEG